MFDIYTKTHINTEIVFRISRDIHKSYFDDITILISEYS